jgi:hypothetical protein
MNGLFSPCMCCGREYTESWIWYRCDQCGFRICQGCLSAHRGEFGSGLKCSRCVWGWMRKVE